MTSQDNLQGVFQDRRQRLMAQMLPGSAAVFISGGEQVRSRDTTHPYRASSDVLYLTGFEEPEAVVLIIPERQEGQFVMFVRPRDKALEIWNGRRAGPEGAVERFGADEAHNIDELPRLLPELLAKAQVLYHHLGKGSDGRVVDAVDQLRKRRGVGVGLPHSLRECRDLVHPMRQVKSAFERQALQKACDLTAKAHIAAMKACRPGMHEYELEAIIEFVFARHGAKAPAYESIVGAGANAAILHYTENNALIKDGDMVLIDAGAELGYYAGDITRSFPANGRFSPVQRDLYQAVLEAEIAAIEMCTVGTSWMAIHEATVAKLTASMVDLGLLAGDVDALIEDEAYKKFYMHKTGHWLGMDVHDVGPYMVDGEHTLLADGFVKTIEPGLYIQPGAEGVDERFWGIGIRIEDDVLVTEQGPVVLTSAVPKTIDEVEALVGSGLNFSF